MSRYDKYDGKTGGFRARLAADFAYTASNPDYLHVDLDKTFAAGLSTTGLVGKFGASFPTFCGLLILTRPKAAGDVVDIMTAGEIVELLDAEILAADVLTAGTKLYADPAVNTGVLTKVATANRSVGFTVELNATTGKSRLVVRCSISGLAA